jgi:hypothetical protein
MTADYLTTTYQFHSSFNDQLTQWDMYDKAEKVIVANFSVV